MNTPSENKSGPGDESGIDAPLSREAQPDTSYNQLFTVDEAFVRLGQNRQNGELLVLNKEETLHVFVENGYVVHAQGVHKAGEAAFIHALNLKSANFVWVTDSQPLVKDIHIDIREYLLRHALARDFLTSLRIDAQKRETLSLPRNEAVEVEEEEAPEIDCGFYFVPEKNPGSKFGLKKNVNLVGREIYCDWVIDDVRISRKHCILQLTNRGVLVRDLESANGTFVNGKVVGDGYLKVGDRLSLGGYMLTLRRENPTKQIIPVIRNSLVAAK